MTGLLPANQKAGISFIVRCRNEEQYIGDCIESLKDLKIPHEIVVILHQCTDQSKAIVERLQRSQPIVIIEYNQNVSRAGYETLVTPLEHPASLASYYNFCFGHARYNWTMKWDADFSCSPGLIEYLNNRLDPGSQTPTAYRIRCQLGEEAVNAELYLTNVLAGFSKHVFWEVPVYSHEYQEISLGADEAIKSISTTVLKNYWRAAPWFLQKPTYDKNLADKYHQLVEILGPEPLGMARASNPACDAVFRAVLDNENALEAAGIHLYT